MTDLREAAARALKTHDALTVAYASEPPSDDNGYPLDSLIWQEWHHDCQQPAYVRWSEAMDNLAAALNEPGMSRHPHNFRPRCEAILRG